MFLGLVFAVILIGLPALLAVYDLVQTGQGNAHSRPRFGVLTKQVVASNDAPAQPVTHPATTTEIPSRPARPDAA